MDILSMNLMSMMKAMVTSSMDIEEEILEWTNIWKNRISLHYATIWRN